MIDLLSIVLLFIMIKLGHYTVLGFIFLYRCRMLGVYSQSEIDDIMDVCTKSSWNSLNPLCLTVRSVCNSEGHKILDIYKERCVRKKKEKRFKKSTKKDRVSKIIERLAEKRL